MSYELKKAEDRLDNVRKVKPILAALRTISLGSWQMARSRREGLSDYSRRLLHLLPCVLPRVTSDGGTPLRRFGVAHRKERRQASHQVVLVIGSERGLCGRYNATVLTELETLYSEWPSGVSMELMALGSRMIRELRRAGYELAWTQSLSVTTLPSYAFAYELVSTWLQRYEAYEVDAVDVLYNADAGATTYRPKVARVIPPEIPGLSETGAEREGICARPEEVIIETDPVRLYVRIVEQWTATALYGLLLEAAVTEHAARYQMMESATQNADELIEDLMLTVQSARREAITREMQELAVGAGLLGDEDT
ncbi:MAG: F0F1 ATP synthase subunit gamma [Anaerolineae bacterium]